MTTKRLKGMENKVEKDKETAVVICPGRGTYNATELGAFHKYHAEKHVFLTEIEDERARCGQSSITSLDKAEKFKPRLHTNSENASAVIYACALGDFADIDRDKFEIVAATGNSMGWYLALTAAGVLNNRAGIQLVNTMGSLMHNKGVGGQVIYPLVNDRWQADAKLTKDAKETLEELHQKYEIAVSIELGGMRLFAASDEGVKALLQHLPKTQERYPFQLPNHAAFHSPLLSHVPDLAMDKLPQKLFGVPEIPLVDGRGHIWQPYATSTDALYQYTLGEQITDTYNYSLAIEVCLKEFAPDKLIILGPGSTLGPPTAQALISHHWQGLTSKAEFTKRQKEDPFILAMGIESQRDLAIA